MTIDFHPEAEEEATLARQWYDDRSALAGRRFQDAFDWTIDQISQSPSRWPKGLHKTRFLIVDRFPYVVIHRHQGEDILVVGVAHASRRPGYWKERLKS